MSKDLYDLADSVETEEDFLIFIKELMRDRNDEEQKENANPSSPWDPGSNGWENGSIVSFLNAALAWGQSTSKWSDKPSNP